MAKQAKNKLLEAALRVFREKGYTAATVDDLCSAAGVTKGGFFHHFESKQALALAAIAHWNEVTGALFEQAPYQAKEDPRAKLLAYLDFRSSLIDGELPEFTCLLGTLVQELFASHPALRDAAAEGIERHIRTLVPAIAAAKRLYAPRARWDAESLARHIQAGLQGAFIVAKAGGGEAAARDSIGHLKRYVEQLLPAN